MNEVKQPKKQWITYMLLVIVVMILLNSLVMPSLQRAQITETDYNTFITMTENDQVKEVQISSSQILFTDTEGKVYATAPVTDPELASRLHQHNVKFGSDIVQPMSPLLSFLLSWVLPIGIFAGLGYMLNKRMMDQAGGANSLMFGMGKSNAKIYVKSTEGIKFSDVAGEEEAKENLQEIVEYLHNPANTRRSARRCPKAFFSLALPEPERPCWPRRSQANPMCHSSPCPVRNLWRCSSAWELQKSATSSSRLTTKPPASCSSTR